MAVDLKSVPCRPSDVCGICLEGNIQDGVAHTGGEAHLFHRACSKSWAIEKPKNTPCPVCRIQINPQSILTDQELQGSLVMRELAERRERQEVAQDDANFANELYAEGFQGVFDDRDGQIAADAALAQALQVQENTHQKVSNCVTIGLAVGAIVVGYLAARYFF